METATQARFRKYPAYKDSGVKWLGDIPEGWTLGKLGTLLKPISIKGHSDLPLLSITRELGVIERNLDEDEGNHNFIPDDLSGYKVIQEGQFGMNKMKAWQGSYGISQFTGIVSPAYYVFDFTSEIDPRFFHFAIRSKNYVAFFGRASDGVRIGQWDLSKSRMKEIPFFIPTPPEQTAISNFLDDKTSKIDRAIAQKEQLIALLKERKQIIIQNAVTKGLDPNVKMKDSGVEWIGEIPEEWGISKSKFYSKIFVPERTKPELEEDKLYGFPWITTDLLGNDNLEIDKVKYFVSPKNAKTAGSRVIKKGSILATCVGNFGIASINDFDCIINQQVQGYTQIKLNPKYFIQIVRISKDFFSNNSTMTTIQYVSKDTFGELPMPIPPISEQTAIVAHIEAQSTKIDQAISLQQTQIEKLKEYKVTLIDSAVTGKIKVS